MRPTRARADDDRIRATTILGMTAGGRAALGGDGQVTNGSVILKANARKTRRLAGGTVLAGFAGSAADGLQLFERFEAKLEAFHGNLRRAAVELARDWRSDRVLRRLDAQLAAVNMETALLLTGSGDVVEPDDGIVAVGSGGPFALAACRALRRHTGFEPARCVAEALAIAAEMCVYTGAVQDILVLPETDLPADRGPGFIAAPDHGGNSGADPEPGLGLGRPP
jgi:ATP-dependent HslUV protease subunit HslV